MPAGENCENCGRVIGKLETPHLWQKHVVCAACHANLAAAADAPAAPVAPRPIGPPPLKARPHYHAAVVPAHEGPPAAPIALAPTAPIAHAASMFLCTACGQTFPIAETASDHGKLVCRTCAIAAAADRARRAQQDKQQSNILRTVVAVAAVVVLGGLSLGAWKVVSSRKDAAAAAAKRQAEAASAAPVKPLRSVLTTDPAPPRAEATAETPPSTEKGLFPHVAPEETATVDGNAPDPSATEVAVVTPEESPAAVAKTEFVSPQSQMPLAPAAATIEQQAPQGTSTTAPPPAAAPAPAPAPPPPQGTAAFHVYQGKALLGQNKLQPALAEFTAATKLDRNNPDAHHGAGLCFHAMGNRDSAIERLEKAHSLYNPPNRAAVYNLGVALLKDNPMRAAKITMDYLSTENAPPDEQMHNLMGKSISNLPRQAQKAKLYADAEAFYYAYNSKLETGRTDGRMRWGSEWVPARDATQKWERFKTRKQNAEGLRAEVAQATKRKEDAWSKVYDMRTGMRLYSDNEKITTNKRYKDAAENEIAVRQKLKAAEKEFSSTEKPPMPQVLKPVTMDATTPPPVGPQAPPTPGGPQAPQPGGPQALPAGGPQAPPPLR